MCSGVSYVHELTGFDRRGHIAHVRPRGGQFFLTRSIASTSGTPPRDYLRTLDSVHIE